MAIERVAIAVFLLLLSVEARAGCGDGIGRMSGLFFDQKERTSGELDGLELGSKKSEVIQFLLHKGISKVQVVPERDFYATYKCVQALQIIPPSGVVHISGENNRLLGVVWFENGRVSRTQLKPDFSASIPPGMAREAAIKELRRRLVDDRRLAVFPVPSCGLHCVLDLTGPSQDGGQLGAVDGWKFHFPGDNKSYEVKFSEGVLVRASYVRQRFKGDGVF
jgi:hypothetical protein